MSFQTRMTAIAHPATKAKATNLPNKRPNFMHPLQAMINGMSQEWQRERSSSQLTLGKLIERLAAMPQDALIEGFGNPHSYRGYYCDLSFERTEEKFPVSKALEMCRGAMGQVFEGYKGGDFQMGANTPLWLAEYGCCGNKFMGVRDDGTLDRLADE